MRVLDEFTRLRGFPLTTAATALKFQTRGAFPTVSGHNRRKGWWLQLAAPACTGADRPWEESGENKRNSCVHGADGGRPRRGSEPKRGSHFQQPHGRNPPGRGVQLTTWGSRNGQGGRKVSAWLVERAGLPVGRKCVSRSLRVSTT